MGRGSGVAVSTAQGGSCQGLGAESRPCPPAPLRDDPVGFSSEKLGGSKERPWEVKALNSS